MSYLFSEAKNGTDHHPGAGGSSKAELPLRARLILIWMLLVELLRKKVEVIQMRGWYSGTAERAGHVLWLGSLVFSNLQGVGRKAMMGILWLLCVTKLIQRVSFTEVGKRSLALGKNARLNTSYMAQVLEKDRQGHHHVWRPGDATEDALLKGCKYAVMEEDRLVLEAIPSGYRLKEDADAAAVTVGKIWELAETDPLLSSLDQDRRLRRLCLSFSLFKLLRRRFERLTAMTAAETRSYREQILRGLYGRAEVYFQVTNNELNFLCEYYHSVIPVVLASPFFLLANYLLLPLVVFVLCLVVIVLCGNGDVPLTFSSIKKDDYFTFFGAAQMVPCLGQFFTSPMVFFCTIDFSITSLLFLLFIYEEVWEFLVFLLSDWFTVSLLCNYANKSHWKNSPTFSCAIRCILFARKLLSRPAISFDQFCVLTFCGLTVPAQLPAKVPILLPTVAVPKEVEQSIMDYLTRLYDRDGNPTAVALSNGRLALAGHSDLLPFCDSDSVAEVILTWHVATSLLEVKHPPRSSVATSLSRYCAYLVAFHPELLPDNRDSAERVFQGMKDELYGAFGFWGYYFSRCRLSRHQKIAATTNKPAVKPPAVVAKGAALGQILADKAVDSEEGVWKVLAELWVELVVYIAPSSDEECVAGHGDVLAKGGEFITVLWAMATHAGISRPVDAPPGTVPIERVGGATHDDASV